MKHQWEPFNHETPAMTMMCAPGRICVHCKARQDKETQYSWMRVVGYRWYPLVGRCKGKP